MPSDQINLSVPAKGEYARIVRMTAAAIVSRMGMGYDDVEDVKMAAEEAFVFAADTMKPGEELTFSFEIEDHTLSIVVALGCEAVLTDDEVERRAAYATFILESVCDEFELASDENGRPSLRLTKTAGSDDEL